mgnify:CR=1 FL=1
MPLEEIINKTELPGDWLKKLAEKHLSEEEMAEIKSLGGFEKLMETLKKRLEEQKARHQGGNKWIGTSGTSPFGAYGYNPEGIRIGQNESRHKKAVFVRMYLDHLKVEIAETVGAYKVDVANCLIVNSPHALTLSYRI